MKTRGEIAETIYRAASFRYWAGLATPRDFEDIICLFMDETTPLDVWRQASQLRMMMIKAGVPFRTEIPEAVCDE